MSLFERRDANQIAAVLDLARRRGTPSLSGPLVNQDTAMRLSTAWACVNLLAELVGVTIDYHGHRIIDGIQQRMPSDPAIVTNPSPTPNIDAVSWRRQVVVSWLLRGNAWGLVTSTDDLGRPTSIDILPPDYITYFQRGQLGQVEYRLLGQPIDIWPLGPLWHKPLYVVPGVPVGLSPIEYGAQSMGLGLAAEAFGARWFNDGAVPTGILKSDQIIDDDVAESIKARFMESVGGGRREPVALGRGLDYEPISLRADESQFLDTIKATKTDVASFFGLQVAPELFGGESGGSMTYSNVEQQNLNVLLYAASGLIKRMEELLTELTSRPTIVKADLKPLLRVDAKTESEIDTADLRSGKRSQDEVRADSNLPPVPGGRRLNWPPMAVAADHASMSGEGDDEHPLNLAAPTTSEPQQPASHALPGDDPAADPADDQPKES